MTVPWYLCRQNRIIVRRTDFPIKEKGLPCIPITVNTAILYFCCYRINDENQSLM